MIARFVIELVMLSLQATVLIACVLLLRLYAGRWLSPRWTYALWILLLLKLTLPWTPESPLSIERLFSEHTFRIIASWDFGMSPNDTVQEIDSASELSANDFTQNMKHQNQTTLIIDNDGMATDSIGTANTMATIRNDHWSVQLFIAIWISGVLLFVMRLIRDIVTSNRLIHKSQPINDSHLHERIQFYTQKLGIKKQIEVRVSSEVNTPALARMLKPVILLPDTFLSNYLNNETVTYAILHELHHLKRKDIQVNMWFCLLLCLHWFNPLLWIAYRQFRQDQEIACDHSVLSMLSQEDRYRYALTILKWADYIREHPIVRMSVHGFGGRSSIRRRIHMISQYRQQRFIYRIFFTILFAFLSVVFLTAGVQSENNEQIKWQIPAEGMVINKEAYKAIAITNEEGTPVTSAADGVVRYAAYTSENGYRIEIDHGQGWVTTYSHLQSIDVEVQQRVSSGEKIAAMGSTGQSTGVHLKFEVVHEDKLIDPQSILTFVLSDDHEPIFPLQFPVAEPFQLLTTYGINAGKNSANEFHPGIDIAAENESPIQAAAGGIVKIAQYDPNYGNHVIIDHGLGWISTYSHLDELAVQEQSIVQKGSILGTMGSTGKTTGVHLHFEMHRGDKPVDPMSYFLHTDNDVRGLTWEELQTVLYP